LHMKTEGELQQRLKDWLQNICLLFFFLWAVATVLTLIYEQKMADIFRTEPAFLSIVFLGLIGIVAIPKFLSNNRPGLAFLSSFLIILSLVLTYALGTFPAVVKAFPEENSLTIANASASPITLHVLFVIACIGVPLFLCYGIYAYKVFRGKVELDTMSY